MVEDKTYRKCPNCGAMNLNQDYCTECGTLVNTLLCRELERAERAKKKSESKKDIKPNAITQIFKKAMNHPNLIVRILAKTFYSIWAIVLLIGTIIAFLFTYVAA